MPVIKLTLTVEQARILRDAIDLNHRLRLGQLGELRDVWPVDHHKREQIEAIAALLKATIFPELSGPGHSYGVGSNLGIDVQRMYEIYKVLDHAVWQTLPDPPSWTVSGDNPYILRYSGDARIPFEVVP